MGNPDISKIDKNMAVSKANVDGMDWYEIDQPEFVLDGFAWRKPGGGFRRLPEEFSLNDSVDELAWHTAGGMLRFATDAAEIRIDVKLHHTTRMDHQAAIGSKGFDLYSGRGRNKRLVGVSRFDRDCTEYLVSMVKFPEQSVLRDYSLQGSPYVLPEGGGKLRMREYTLHFPLYCGVKSLRIGFNSGAKLAAPEPWPDPRPIVVYGTSIQQGGCASRPGMAHTNIMSRMLNRPFINLGFSGSGKGESKIARQIATIADPAMFVLDYHANAKNDGVRKTLPDFIDILRSAHPAVPILLVSCTQIRDEFMVPGGNLPGRQEQTAIYLEELNRRRASGDDNIFFLDGAALLGDEPWEGTVDGVHPTDLGFYMMARNTAPAIAAVLD